MSKIRKPSQEMSTFLDDILKENNEMTTRQIVEKLYKKFPDLNISLATLKHARRENGWVCTCPPIASYFEKLINSNKKMVSKTN